MVLVCFGIVLVWLEYGFGMSWLLCLYGWVCFWYGAGMVRYGFGIIVLVCFGMVLVSLGYSVGRVLVWF